MIRRAIILGILALAVACGACRKSEPTLSLLVWEGYADPSFVRPFVISPSSDVATSIARAGLAAPLELSKFPSYNQLSARLRNSPLVKLNGQTCGVPFVWGPNPLLYDTTAFTQAPDSWSIFWDPKYKGKISLWDELSSIYMAAQVLGYDKADPNQIYNLSDDQLEAVKKKLIELKPNIRKYWSTGGELTNLFQNHEIIAAMGWPLMTNQLRKLNFSIGETIPKENTTGWIDHLMITAASQQKELAAQFLEYMIEPQTQKKITDVTGYAPANSGSTAFMTDAEKKNLHMDSPDAYMQRIYFWQDVPRRAKYNEIWNEVKAAQ
jgi:putative spermidine/putrescine transport system substrate-binding protein/spermidine/putrescine transport system substrate-binding protein